MKGWGQYISYSLSYGVLILACAAVFTGCTAVLNFVSLGHTVQDGQKNGLNATLESPSDGW